MTEQYISSDEFKGLLAGAAGQVNSALACLLEKHAGIHSDLKRAMAYSLEAPGKRIRGAMVLWCCEAVCGEIMPGAKAAAGAVEMVHTYSLVHDDLPSLDDDDMRRGQPTCHKAFGEAMAILAGDALLTFAFEVLAVEISDAEAASKLISVLAKASGGAGMIAGQVADIAGEKSGGGLEMLEYIHTNKTAKMFEAAAVMGGICGGASKEQISDLRGYGMAVGLGFQVADDILDVSASSEELGKTAGKDAMQEKITYPAVVGLDESKRIANDLADKAIESLSSFDGKADVLRQLSIELLSRSR
ncbi:MAG: polyprenyl synthetase family protein [Planctomycetes bacterium]|nr:polyprenyl synthetase family protein [Planctomycetota bacterium]